jgi:anti-anti-sigma factor
MFGVAHIRSRTTPPAALIEGPAAGGESPDTEDGTLPLCTISIRRYPGWSAVMLRGELDRQSASELRAAVAEELAEGQPVIVELVGLEFADLDGVRALADLALAGERCRGEAAVEVHGARGQVARLIELLGLDYLLSRPRGLNDLGSR